MQLLQQGPGAWPSCAQADFTAPAGTSTAPDDLTGEPARVHGQSRSPHPHDQIWCSEGSHIDRDQCAVAITPTVCRRFGPPAIRPRHQAASRGGTVKCKMSMGIGMIREWLAHSTAQLPLLLAATTMLLVAGASARYMALIGTRGGRRPRIATRHGDRFTLRHPRDAL